MNIFATGSAKRIQELEEKVSSEHVLTVLDYEDIGDANLRDFDVIIDLNFDDHPEILSQYAMLTDQVVMVSAVKTQLVKAVFDANVSVKARLIGFNALPTFIDRDLAEVSLYKDEDKGALESLMKDLEWEYRVVEDRVGMVTPRIIFMIVNEACFTVQEGTASMQDIDLGMKKGTNYPLGPFEWADKIGIKDIYETLAALYEDTKDERYKIAPLLKNKYLSKGQFYQ